MDATAPGEAGVSLPVIGGPAGFIPGPGHACAKCASVQKTCCQRAEVLVTAGDIARITRHTGRADFHERRKPADPAYADQPDDPNWNRYVFDESGTRTVLRRQSEGDCTFLGSTGCTLPTEVRPLACRLYPFQYNESGITGIEAEYCPVVRVVPPGQGVVEALGMNIADAARWHAMLYDELRTKRERDENRPDLRPAG